MLQYKLSTKNNESYIKSKFQLRSKNNLTLSYKILNNASNILEINKMHVFNLWNRVSWK